VQESILYDVSDAAVYPITAPGDADTPPSYGTGVDVPGIRTVTLGPTYESNSLRGDGRTIDKRTKLTAVSLTFGYGKLAPDVLAVVDGGTATTVGTGASTVTEYRRMADDQVPYFGFVGQVTEVDDPTGSALLVVAYAKIEDGTLFGSETDSYGEPEFSAEAVPTPSGFLWSARLATTREQVPAYLSDLLAALSAP
jgi:hypothetical protein